MDSKKAHYDPSLVVTNQLMGSRFGDLFDHINANVSTEQPTTKSPSDNGGNANLNDSYKMAAQVAVGAAIIVALTILLALIWNSLKRRLSSPGNPGTASSTSRRYSSDSFERLVEDRLRNRPPPYSPDQDKPPSYEDSFHDSSSRHRSPASRRRDRRRNQGEMTHLQMPTVHETNRYPTELVGRRPSSSSLAQTFPVTPVSHNTAVHTVIYDNQAFSVDEDEHQPSVDIPSISMVVFENEASVACKNTDGDESVIMLHL